MKKEIAYFMRRLYRQKLTTTSGGNISVRKDKSVFITPSAIDKGEMLAEQVGELDLEGNIIESKHKLSIETAMHLAIYKARPDVSAIVHAHPPYGTAYASSNKTLNSKLTSEGRLVLGNIAFAKYALMGTQDLADLVANEAKNSNVILMENLSDYIRENVSNYGFPVSLKEAVKNFEREHIINVIKNNNYNKEETAKALVIGLSSLYRKMEELNIPTKFSENDF